MELRRAILIGGLTGVVLAGFQIYRLEATPVEATASPTFGELVKPLVKWPCEVILQKDKRLIVKKHGIPVGYVVVKAGVSLTAYDLNRDGMLEVQFVDQMGFVPMEDTDLLTRTPFATYRPSE